MESMKLSWLILRNENEYTKEAFKWLKYVGDGTQMMEHIEIRK